MSGDKDLPTIEEYLRLEDWQFRFQIKEGKHKSFHWLRSRHLEELDVFDFIDLPKKPFCVLVVYLDSQGCVSLHYEDKEGWQAIGDYAISTYSQKVPEIIEGSHYDAQILLDEIFTHEQISRVLEEYVEPSYLEDGEHPFWKAIEKLRPYFYYSYGSVEGFTLITREEQTYRNFVAKLPFDQIGNIYRETEQEERNRKWEDLGPECGPELCIEENCTRSRIKLAVRCFFHHIESHHGQHFDLFRIKESVKKYQANQNASEKYFLKSERLGFRNWTDDDIYLAEELWGNPLVTRFIAQLALEKTEVMRRLKKEIGNHKEAGVQYWPIFQIDGGDFVGCCGLRPYRVEERVYEIGFHIKPEKWGSGFATEAARTVIDFARSTMKLKGLFAGHHPDNSLSKKVLSKLGFLSTGTAFYEPTGRQHPSYFLNLNKGT